MKTNKLVGYVSWEVLLDLLKEGNSIPDNSLITRIEVDYDKEVVLIHLLSQE